MQRRVACRAVVLVLLSGWLVPAAHGASVATMPGFPAVALGDAGGAAIAYARTNAGGTGESVQVVLRSSAASGFATPEQVWPRQGESVDISRGVPRVAAPLTVGLAPSGAALVTWQMAYPYDRAGPQYETWGRWRMPDGTWKPADRLSTLDFDPAKVAMAPDGRAYAVDRFSRLRTARPGEVFSSAEQIEGLAFTDKLQATNLGLVAVGQGSGRPTQRFRLVRRTLSGRYTSVDLLLDNGSTPNVRRPDSGPALFASPDGTTAVAWGQSDTNVPSLQVAVVAPGATSAQPVTATTGGSLTTFVRAIVRDGDRVSVLADRRSLFPPSPSHESVLVESTDGGATYVSRQLSADGLAYAGAGADGALAGLWAPNADGTIGGGLRAAGTAAFAPISAPVGMQVDADRSLAVTNRAALIARAAGAFGAPQPLEAIDLRPGADAVVTPIEGGRMSEVTPLLALPEPQTVIRVNKNGRLRLRIRCRQYECVGRLTLRRGTRPSAPVITSRTIHLGANRSRVYSLPASRSVVTAMRRGTLKRIGAQVAATGTGLTGVTPWVLAVRR